MQYFDLTQCNLVSNKMKINFNMLGSLMMIMIV
jgi:hypothetical protein